MQILIQGRSNVKGHVGHVSTSFWVSKDNFSRILPKNQVEILDITLLYGYSLIIAKNFVTVYTAFDYWNRVNLL